MASKKDFKKYVDQLGSAVVNEIIAASCYGNADQEKLHEALTVMLGAIGKARNNANITFDRGRRAFADPAEYSKAKRAIFKALFDKINTELSEETNEALKLFNSAIPADEKERNKQYANE